GYDSHGPAVTPRKARFGNHAAVFPRTSPTTARLGAPLGPAPLRRLWSRRRGSVWPRPLGSNHVRSSLGGTRNRSSPGARDRDRRPLPGGGSSLAAPRRAVRLGGPLVGRRAARARSGPRFGAPQDLFAAGWAARRGEHRSGLAACPSGRRARQARERELSTAG